MFNPTNVDLTAVVAALEAAGFNVSEVELRLQRGPDDYANITLNDEGYVEPTNSWSMDDDTLEQALNLIRSARLPRPNPVEWNRQQAAAKALDTRLTYPTPETVGKHIDQLSADPIRIAEEARTSTAAVILSIAPHDWRPFEGRYPTPSSCAFCNLSFTNPIHLNRYDPAAIARRYDMKRASEGTND